VFGMAVCVITGAGISSSTIVRLKLALLPTTALPVKLLNPNVMVLLPSTTALFTMGILIT
jgi:hypothetical protein